MEDDVFSTDSRYESVPLARAALGALAGVTSGALVGALLAYQGMFTDGGVFPGWVWYAFEVIAVGSVLGLAVGHQRQTAAVTACGGVLLGCLGWLLFSLTLVPLTAGHAPTWSAAAAIRTYPELVGSVLQGGLAGVVLAGLLSLRARVRTPRGRRAEQQPSLTRVVIVGGGFAGVSAAKRFERLALRGAPIDVTLVSNSNFLLFTPMLAEAASGAVEARHISAPVRAAVSHTRFRYGTIDGIDVAARTVRLIASTAAETIHYDHLVLAVGSVPHTFGLPGVEEHSWALKSLADATRLRDHVLELLERVEHEPDPAERRRMLTFVVAGAGFAGTEMIAELFDLAHGVTHLYPGIDMDEARFLLVHPGDRILPELPAELAIYASGRLQARGIECRLGLRVAEATVDSVRLSDGRWVPTHTFVWTAGNRPGPLVDALSGEHAGPRGVLTDPMLRVAGVEGVWAVGDCARIPDLDHEGTAYPPTAQHAIREGRTVADNIAAVISGRAPAEFRFRTIGVLVALGHRTAAGDIRGRQFSGLAAWLLWRGIYLSKLPGIEKRIRVLFDWLLDLAFPRDIVITASRRPSAPPTRNIPAVPAARDIPEVTAQ